MIKKKACKAKKAKIGNWDKKRPDPTKKKDIIIESWKKKPAKKRKWYEKPIKFLKGRSK
jgi:hypothetical protein